MTTNYKLIRYWILIVFTTLNAACISQIPSLDDYAHEWMGQSIDRLNRAIFRRNGNYADRINWKEKTYLLPNGNTAYVEPVREDCFIHWEVNKARIIVAHKTEGIRCW
jgi:hypothetical protein